MIHKNKILLGFAIILICLGLLFVIQVQGFGKLRLIFCDVGQGDGILIVTPGGEQVIIDGGPGTKILDCLGRYMPFWDRKIEMMVLTHPDKDHIEGQVSIFENYQVQRVITTGVSKDTDLYRTWAKALEQERSQVTNAYTGQKIEVGNVDFDVLWPTLEKLDIWKIAPPAAVNESSIILRLQYGRVCAYLTGDITKEILETLVDKQCQILKVAHHGSRTGTNESILNLIKPKVAVIQVGKNSYGHPHKEVLDLLNENNARVLRNDLEGDIELNSDGESLSVK